MPSSSEMERKFNAAVNVIRGLPKNGSYQPSNDMMLRFYSFYKQATLGSCTQPKPAFWDVVGRAKYDAYKALGNMPKERAMELYVDELKKIIETMSYTENVAEFMGIMNDFQGNDADDREAVAPQAIRDVGSNSTSRSVSRDASPVREANGLTNGRSSRQEYSTVNGNSHIQEILQNGYSSDQHSDDEYIDTVEDDVYLLREPIIQNRIPRPTTRRPYIEPQIREITTTTTTASINSKPIEPVIHQILRTIESMRIDLQRINSRIDNVERSMTDVKNHQLRKKIMTLRYPRWWPFADISPNWFFVLILWPFVARQLARMLQRKSK
ncbi:acyl-CoA-binding domain-containing protein 5-like [Bradysia coprophila]|uniref:acyl-CoA-binding domain-containing protein 5-like n=1 Tax=Bradysia coprophila TaxID=38358 RepID=UPI00187D6F9A|nr:acyl-CoA-binding domain-containing protein 5-like [Bradysia coprophila]